MDITQPDSKTQELVVLTEKDKGRPAVAKALLECVNDHFADLGMIKRIGGYSKALTFIRTKLPSYKKVRSGDFGEMMATEYVNQCTEYTIPIKKLRWKDDRNTTMRGDDAVGFKRQGKSWRVLKVESKSRAALSEGVVGEAVASLRKHSGRPNPSTLGYISSRLRELNRDDEAKVFEQMQKAPPAADRVEHLVFTLSGNNPTAHLRSHLATRGAIIRRHLVGCVIVDHQKFIAKLFDTAHAGND